MAAGWNKGKKWPAEVKQNIVDGLRVYYQTHEHFMHRPYHKPNCRCERCKKAAAAAVENKVKQK